MIGMTVTVDSVAFEGAMQRLQQGVRAGFIDPQYGLLPVQGKLLAERCQAFTPPRNVGQGKAAVARDITRIFRPLSHTTFTHPGIRKIIKTDNRPAWDAAARNFGSSHNLNNTRAIGFSRDWHKKNRVSRGRAAPGKGGNLGVVTLGPEGRQVRQYIREVKGRVGWARAGWNAGVGFGNVKDKWVAKHGMGSGFRTIGTGPDPFFHAGNTTSWARYGSAGEGNRILRNAINARARDMEAYYFRMMKVAAAKSVGAAA